MALNVDALVAAAYKTADSLGILKTITYEPFTGNDSNGYPEYGTPITLKVVLNHAHKRPSNSPEGQISTSQIVILQRMEINERDRFTLPGGAQPSVMDLKGPDISNGIPVTEVWF